MADAQRVALNLKADILYARRQVCECLDPDCVITQFWRERCDNLLDSLMEMLLKNSEPPIN